MLFALGAIAAGVVLLTVGADRLVDAAASIARALGVSAVLIGALVVGLGTSAPEFLVTGLAAGRGELDLAVGNVIGSNIANVTLVLGSAALMAPIISRREVLRREGLLMMIALAVFALALVDINLGFWEAAGLAGGMVVAAVLIARWSMRDAAAAARPDAIRVRVSVRREAIAGLIALAVTLTGAELLVRGATRLAEEFDLTAGVVGLTIVAIGTSLPELATSVAGARRGEGDIVIGNVLGSNLFNSLAVAGFAGLVAPGTVGSTFRFSVAAMLLTGGAAAWFAYSGGRLVRAEGVGLLAAFAVFLWFTF